MHQQSSQSDGECLSISQHLMGDQGSATVSHTERLSTYAKALRLIVGSGASLTRTDGLRSHIAHMTETLYWLHADSCGQYCTRPILNLNAIAWQRYSSNQNTSLGAVSKRAHNLQTQSKE
eukprot:3488321-Amphidinium_carterae.1